MDSMKFHWIEIFCEQSSLVEENHFTPSFRIAKPYTSQVLICSWLMFKATCECQYPEQKSKLFPNGIYCVCDSDLTHTYTL